MDGTLELPTEINPSFLRCFWSRRFITVTDMKLGHHLSPACAGA
ncbi:mCG1030145 [Mus musculus]|nr:mCG1030145 [Mus musculus]